MNYRHIALAVAFVCASAAVPTQVLPTQAQAGEPRAVVELFTSQGCSSCPPADSLAGELARDPSLLVMTLPVDYWDYLGWKDTLALHGHTKRQRAYAEARGDREVYTPQVVVNGIVHVLGSDKAAIENAVAQTRRSAMPLTLPVKVAVADGKVTVSVAEATGDHRSGEVWLCPISGKVPVTIGRGENRGSTVTYHNVVRRWVKLGNWNGTAQSFSAKLADLANDNVALGDLDRVIVMVQSGVTAKPGVMLGAASAACCGGPAN